MMKHLATGLVTGAFAVLVLVISRPVPLRQLVSSPPASPAVDYLLTAHAIETTELHAADVSTRAAVRAKLEKVLPVVEFENATLAQVVERFREWTGANIILHPRIDTVLQSKVTIRLTEIRACDALRVVLATARPNAWGYRIWSGTVLISDEPSPQLMETDTRLYDVRDLLDEANRHAPLHSGVAPNNAGRDPLGEFMTAVRESIDPTSWRDAGGSIGTLHPWAGRLLITQTPENHQKIQHFFAMLRASTNSKK